VQDDLYRTLPPVIPFASLLGEPAAPDIVLPVIGQLVRALTTPAGLREVAGPQNVRYDIRPDGTWEYRCPIRLFPGAIRLKVDGFRQQWGARVVAQDEDSFRFLINLPAARRFWERVVSPPRRLEVDLHVVPLAGLHTWLTEAHVRVRPAGGAPDQMARITAELAPQLFDSLRSYLQASPEQRAEARRPCPHPLHVYPVLPDLELADAIEGLGRNISPGGISFRLPQLPPTEKLYLHFHQAPGAAEFALLARVVRRQPSDPDGYEIGAAFPAGSGGQE
jgi:hypothetical protein